MAKMVTWSTQTNSSSGLESQSFRVTRKNISRGGQRFPQRFPQRCVDETNLSAQFKMLRLQSCLAGGAAETVKGPGYLDHAYKAAKARLN